MANKHDSFDMDKWSKGKKEKKEKPIKEEKEPKIKLSDDGDFSFDKKIKREKIKKEPKEHKIKDDEGSFNIGGKEKPLKEPKGRKVREGKSFEMDNGDKSFDMEEQKNKKLDFKSLTKKKWFVPAVVSVFALVVIGVVALIIGLNPSGNSVEDTRVNKIFVTSLPIKTEYKVGEEADFYGLEVTVLLNNGMTLAVNENDCEITGFDSSAPNEKQVITVKYKAHTATFVVSIVEDHTGGSGNTNNPGGDNGGSEGNEPYDPNKVVELTLIAYPKTNYKVGEYLDLQNGKLLIKHADNTTEEIELQTDHYIGGFTTDKPGKYTVTLGLFKDGKLTTTTYTITVTE